MPIRTRRWCDPRQPGDGLRVLICRYRPRGLPKSQETWDIWLPDLGPSRELHAAYYGKHGPPLGWEEYADRYCREIAQRPSEVQELIAELAAMLREGRTITLLCSSACTDEAHCHRSLLKKMLEERAGLAGKAAAKNRDAKDLF